MIRSICIALLLFLAFVPIAQSDENTNHRELLAKYYRLDKPKGEGPFPAVLLVSGCSGFNAKFGKKHYDRVQSQLSELGFVTLRVDYLAARNATICVDISSNSVAEDICIAAEFLKQQTYVKKGAINVIGWSYGGAGAFRALRGTGSREPVQVGAVVAYYPYCVAARHWKSDVPVLVLGGAIDNVAPFTACENIFSRIKNKERLTIRVYDDAHHCFDISELPAEMEYQFGTLGYNKAAAESAWNEVTKFLKR